jgi:propionate catabolism operon transcriptional regulator
LGVAPELTPLLEQKQEQHRITMTTREENPSPESYAQVLARFSGNRQAAAKHLGISRTTLWRKLQQE